METKKIKPGPRGIQACDKLMEINRGALIIVIINYVCWSCIDWKTVWVTAMLTSGAVRMSHGEWNFWSILCVTCHILPPRVDPAGHCGSHVVTLSKWSTRWWQDSNTYLLTYSAYLLRGVWWLVWAGESAYTGLLFIQIVAACFWKRYVNDDAPALMCDVWSAQNPCLHYSGYIATSVSLPLLSLHLCASFRTPVSPPTAYSEKVASAHLWKHFPSISY